MSQPQQIGIQLQWLHIQHLCRLSIKTVFFNVQLTQKRMFSSTKNQQKQIVVIFSCKNEYYTVELGNSGETKFDLIPWTKFQFDS